MDEAKLREKLTAILDRQKHSTLTTATGERDIIIAEIIAAAKECTTKQHPVNVEDMMIQTLTDIAPIEGWYRIKDITNNFRLRIRLNTVTSRKVGDILRTLGFTDRRNGTDNYTFIFISHAILNRLADRR